MRLNLAPPSYCFCAAAMVRVVTLGNKGLPGVNIVQSEILYVKIYVPCGSHNLKFTSWRCMKPLITAVTYFGNLQKMKYLSPAAPSKTR